MTIYYTKQDLITRIPSLIFNTVPFIDKGPKYSAPGACHQGVENYVQVNPGTRQVLGWLKRQWGQGHKYILHSCLEENGAVVNITPLVIPLPGDSFAEDVEVLIDPAVTAIFSFVNSISSTVYQKDYDI